MEKSEKQTSIFISLVLRHKPSAAGIELDTNGWACVYELINGMAEAGYKISCTELEQIVSEDDKQRYSFNSDKTKIRANQGHSINVDVEMKEQTPPVILFHGTSDRVLESIKHHGITKQSRQFVHLSSDRKTARNVGLRHGNVVILEVRAEEMSRNGYKFYLSENGVWLTDIVPAEFIRED